MWNDGAGIQGAGIHLTLIAPVRPIAAGPGREVRSIGVGGQLALLAVLWTSVGLSPAGLLAGAGCALLTCGLLAGALRRAHCRVLGAANRITLARAVLVGGVTALVADHVADLLAHRPEPGGRVAVLVAIAAVALLLDALDGRIARRTGTATATGARFDMEVDAFLILVLSLYVATFLGPWVLLIGLMRYAFVAVAWGAPWLRAELPPSTARKTVAAVQGIFLVVAAARSPGAEIVVGLALAALLWSFGRDIVWLWTRRPA